MPRQARSAGDRCGSIASASVRRRDFLVPFWSLKKELARAAGESRALASFCFSWVATANRQEQSFRAVRAAYVCLVKSTHDSAKHWRTTKPARRASTGGASQTAVAVRDPPHEAAVGPCASRSAGRAAQTRCAQTWAALRPRRPAMLGSLDGSNIRRKSGARAKPEPKLEPAHCRGPSSGSPQHLSYVREHSISRVLALRTKGAGFPLSRE